jgi:hypothetical protein
MSEATMKKTLSRCEFVKSACQFGACSCLGVWIGKTESALGQETLASKPGDPLIQRAVKRMEFVDVWVKRFFDVLDQQLDEPTRKKIMQVNGKECYQGWIKSTGQTMKTVPFEQWAARIKKEVKDDSVRVEGNVIYFQYTSSAETGQPSQEGVCLCPLVESKTAGISKTYCQCSVGYVKEMFEQRFACPIDVQLVDSVLQGGKRCKFKITIT